jgi:hypothetical protein
MDEGYDVCFKCRIDIGSSNDPRMKTMSPMCNEEWITYVGVVMKLEIYGIELVAKMVDQNDVDDESSRSPAFPEVVNEHDIKCGIVLTHPSQQTQDDTDACELAFIGSNESILNVKHVSGNVGVGDVVVDFGMNSSVDSQPITISVDGPSVKPEFMPDQAHIVT